jgi:hypothetical protein
MLQAETTVLQQQDSHRDPMEHLNRTATHSLHVLTMAHQLLSNNQAPTMALQAQATDSHQHQLKTSTTSTTNVETATNKPHQALMVFQQLLILHTLLQDTLHQVQALEVTQTADMKNQPNTNSNMMFKTNKPVWISDTRNNVKEALPLAATMSCFPMDVNRSVLLFFPINLNKSFFIFSF